MKNRTFLVIFLFIILLGSLLRLQYLDKPLQRDEQSVFYYSAKNLIEKKTPMFCENFLDEHGRLTIIFNAHTPLYLLYLSSVSFLFNYSVFWLRFFMVIFSILTIILVYFVGSEIVGKKVGLLSSFILSIIRLHVEHAQVIDIDGSFLTFFILLSIFFILKWLKFNKNLYFILSTLSLTITILIKESTILLFPALFIILYKRRKLSEFFYMSIFVFAIAVLFIHIYNSIFSVNIFNGLLQSVNGFVIKKTLTNSLIRLYQFIGIFTWEFTMPLIILSLLSIFYAWRMKNEALNFLIYFTIFYSLFFIAIFGLTRYFTPIIPIISILIANFLLSFDSNFVINRLKIIGLIAILSILALYLMKIRTDVAFLSDVRSNFRLIAVPYVLSVLPIPLIFTRYKKVAITILFGLLIGFNLYFAQEAVNPLVTPDFSKSTVLAAEFTNNNSVTTPIITSADIACFSKIDFYDIEQPLTNLELIQKLVDENKVQYVMYRTNSLLVSKDVKNYLDTNCEKVETYLNKNIEILRIYNCKKI